MKRVITILALTLALVWPALAVQPDEVLEDPILEERARSLSSEIRCLVCQNESIDESNAELARDLRILVRERLLTGDSDQEVLDFLVARYGDYVLLRPPVKSTTVLLWAGPAIILILAGGVILLRMRSSRTSLSTRPAPLSEEEEARVRAVLQAESDQD